MMGRSTRSISNGRKVALVWLKGKCSDKDYQYHSG